MFWNGTGHVGVMWLWWVIILGAIFAVVWFGAKAASRPPTKTGSAEQRLKDRYAAGEIDRETYQRMLDDLRR